MDEARTVGSAAARLALGLGFVANTEPGGPQGAKRRASRIERISHARARFLAFKTAEGQATEHELRLAVAHLRQCAACAAWVEELGALMRSLRQHLRPRGANSSATRSRGNDKGKRKAGRRTKRRR
jgi:hypothetical protein